MKKLQQEIYDENNILIKLSCIDCKEIKSINDFYGCKQRTCGLNAICKICNNLRRKKYYEKNKIKELKRCKKYWEKNHDKYKEWEKNWRKNNKNKIISRRKEKIKNNPSFKLRCSISRRILFALKRTNNRKKSSTVDLLGCSIETLRQHLETQFRDGMSWDNHGKIWHIDHIKPCCSFDLSDEIQQKECFNYTNLRPLLTLENLKKANEDKKISINK